MGFKAAAVGRSDIAPQALALGAQRASMRPP
jgi:hypothetical protein